MPASRPSRVRRLASWLHDLIHDTALLIAWAWEGDEEQAIDRPSARMSYDQVMAELARAMVIEENRKANAEAFAIVDALDFTRNVPGLFQVDAVIETRGRRSTVTVHVPTTLS